LFILQEALSNIRKHANARNVQISLNNSDDFILSIQDDGDGFNINAAKIQSESHIGLKIMRERAAQLGARLEVISKSGQGTTIRLILPHSARMAA
jgi:two-component system nitrate/nitrite sensor histidine kinase NarX